MKLFSLFLALLVTGISWSQGGLSDIKKEKDSCYFRYSTIIKPDGTKVRKRLETKEDMRYMEWECGKTRGLVDCNSDLTYDEGTNTVYKLNTDPSNFAGSNKPFTGKCESCHQNGRIQRKVNFVEGKEDGQDTTYYESGCSEVVRSLVQGVEHGTWYYYFDSTGYDGNPGLLAWEMNFYMGEKHGKHIFFKLNREDPSRLRLDTTKWENYDHGQLDGWKRTYHNNGVLKREVKYDHGIYDGPFRVYNNERVIIEELNYKQGQKDEESKYYYDDGTLLRTENWDEGVKHGEFKSYYYQGHIQTSEIYKKGKKEGWFETFYPDQSPKNRSLYKKDVLIEEHRYDEHGRETYSFGTPTDAGAEDDEMPKKDKKKR